MLAATTAAAADARAANSGGAYQIAALDVPKRLSSPQQGTGHTEHLSVWSRLRAGFQLDHSVQNPIVQQEIRFLMRNPNSWQQRAKRFQLHLPYMVEQVELLNLPTELALVPLVESGMDPYAFSHGGAAGLWQFIPATAKRFGLQTNWWYDGRRDIVAATDAALAYFSFLHQTFDDWYLALAGYNAGEGGVRRALRKASIERVDTRTYWQLPLPAETKRYVPRLLAYAAIINDPPGYGVNLPSVGAQIAFTKVDLPDQFDLMKVADVLDVSIDELYRHNPALNQWATPPTGPHRLLVPAQASERAAAPGRRSGHRAGQLDSP